MKDDHKTKKQPVQELTELRSQNTLLKKSMTKIASSELAAEEALRYAESIVETVREPLLVLDADLKIIFANRNFYRTFKVTPGETTGSFIYDLGNKQWDIPKLRELLEEVLPKQETFDDFEVAHSFRDIGHKIMLLNARQIYREFINTKMILVAIEDITERKRLESLLMDSELQYRRLFETAHDGIVLLEKSEGKITHANPAIEKMLGYTNKESIGNRLQDIGVLLDNSDFPTIMQILNKDGIVHYNDIPIETKSGQYIDTDIYLVDKAQLVQCNIRDTTVHMRLAKEVGVIAEIGRVVGSTLNINQVLERIGAEACNLISYDKFMVNLKKANDNEIVVAYSSGIENTGWKLGGSYPSEGTMSGAVMTSHRGIRAQATDAEEVKYLYPHLYRNFKMGELRSAMGVPLISNDEVIGSMIFRSNKLQSYTEQDLHLAEKIGIQVAGAIANAQLFNDLKKTEKSLRENEEKYRELVEFLPISVFETDISRKITAFNQTALTMFRYATMDSMRDIDLHQLFMPEERERVEKDIQEMMEGASQSSAEYKFIRKDGSSITGLMYASAIIRQGELVGVRGAIADITARIEAVEELHKVNDQLLHSEKLAAIGRLAAGVAHEILNPLNIISLSLQMLMKGSELTSKARQKLTICMEQLHRIVTIAEDLKQFSRIQRTNFVMGDIVAAVDHVLTLYRPQLNMNGIQTDVQYPADLPMTCMDRARIEQVILNLIANAAAVMGKEEKKGKLLRIAIGRETVAGKKDCLRVMVADTGTGISKQDMNKLFDPFFTTKEPGKGTGLGLSISFNIIREHGGRIWVENNKWGGASFFFEIPITVYEEGDRLKSKEMMHG